jgi:uncharacterized protein (TIGR00290 family)
MRRSPSVFLAKLSDTSKGCQGGTKSLILFTAQFKCVTEIKSLIINFQGGRIENFPMSKRAKILLSWSSGKDSAWSLHVLKQQPEFEIVGLITTVNEVYGRVAMHAVRVELLEAQASAVGVSLWKIAIPSPCSNEAYESAMRTAIERAKAEGIAGIAFGDLFLEDIRRYREEFLRRSKITPIFPIWGKPTVKLAQEMIAAGLRARLTCVDPKQLSGSFVGREFDAAFLADLPVGVDPCGERGEFHTFAYDGPMFRQPVPVRVGEIVARDGFVFVDLS